MTLKERLDAVWDHPVVACPNHLVRWNENGRGYSTHMSLGLFYLKGTVRKPKGKEPKGKGYSYLCKYYGIVSANIWRIEKGITGES